MYDLFGKYPEEARLMRTPRPISDESKEQIRRMLKETKSKWEFQRVQCIWMRAELGMGPEEIGKALGWNPGYVRQVQARYLREGGTALRIMGRGGRYRENISLEKEQQLLGSFFEKADQGGVLEVSAIKAAYEKIVSHKVPKSTVYRILERHGWRKISPRPRHPKADKEAQEVFKKSLKK
jgi:transposase